MEVEGIWLCKWTGSSVLFLVNRYGLLLELVFELFFNLPGVATAKQYVYSVITALYI